MDWTMNNWSFKKLELRTLSNLELQQTELVMNDNFSVMNLKYDLERITSVTKKVEPI